MFRGLMLVLVGLVPLLLAACSAPPEVATPDMLLAATFANELGESQEPVDPTDVFPPTGPMNISFEFEGRPKSGLVTATWYFGDEEIATVSVDLAEANSGVIASAGQNTYIGFTLTPDNPFPVSDDYRVDAFLNDEPLGSYSFAVAE